MFELNIVAVWSTRQQQVSCEKALHYLNAKGSKDSIIFMPCKKTTNNADAVIKAKLILVSYADKSGRQPKRSFTYLIIHFCNTLVYSTTASLIRRKMKSLTYNNT